MLGATLFVQAIAPGNLPFIFAMIAFWTSAGGRIVVMYGALNTIPHDLGEAARIDGAGPIAIALRLKLPLIRAVGVPAGYGLAFGTFWGRRLILSLTLLVMIILGAAFVLPICLELNPMHLLGRSLSVILPFAFFPFGVYLAYI